MARPGPAPGVITCGTTPCPLAVGEPFRGASVPPTTLIIPTGKRKGQNPGLASIYRALAEHEKRQAYPEAVEQAHADFVALAQPHHQK